MLRWSLLELNCNVVIIYWRLIIEDFIAENNILSKKLWEYILYLSTKKKLSLNSFESESFVSNYWDLNDWNKNHLSSSQTAVSSWE